MKKRAEKQDVKSLNTHSIDAKLCSHRKVTVRNERAARNASDFICVKMELSCHGRRWRLTSRTEKKRKEKADAHADTVFSLILALRRMEFEMCCKHCRLTFCQTPGVKTNSRRTDTINCWHVSGLI